MKKVLRSLAVIAMLAVSVSAAANVENPLYAPDQFGFYSKTGLGWMYKKSDENLAMKAKDWADKTENPIFRIYEDFGFGITNWLALRGAIGYTTDSDIDRSGFHNARLGLNFRAINSPAETVIWDIYADAWLGGISKMEAEIVKSKDDLGGTYPLSFNYANYANGRWGMWFGTTIGKTVNNFTMSVFGEAQVTFGNNNNEIKITESAKDVIKGMIKATAMPTAIAGTCAGAIAAGLPLPSVDYCRENINSPNLAAVKTQAEALATGIAESYASELPKKFNVDTKGIWDYAAGLKTLYEINNDWSIGGGFSWRHRATNSVEALNIKMNETNVNNKLNAINPAIVTGGTNAASITKGVADSFVGSMEDGVEEFTLNLLGSRKLTDNLQLTLYGEYTFDTAEEKAQLGTNMKAEMGLRLGWKF